MFLHMCMILFMGRQTPWADNPPTPVQEMATAVDGTHHTGMHSFYNLLLKII